MRAKLSRAPVLAALLSAVALLAGVPLRAHATDLKFEAHLVWGTDDATPPPGKDYKPASPDIKKALSGLPFKWANWFEVNRKVVTLPPGGTTSVPLSDKCELHVKDAGKAGLEVSLFGKGKEVVKRTQPLPKGEHLVLGGNAPNSTAWLVVVKRTE
jgi:hypothetical protein